MDFVILLFPPFPKPFLNYSSTPCGFTVQEGVALITKQPGSWGSSLPGLCGPSMDACSQARGAGTRRGTRRRFLHHKVAQIPFPVRHRNFVESPCEACLILARVFQTVPFIRDHSELCVCLCTWGCILRVSTCQKGSPAFLTRFWDTTEPCVRALEGFLALFADEIGFPDNATFHLFSAKPPGISNISGLGQS